MNPAVIVSAVRSPIGTAFKGSLRNVPAQSLAATILRAAVDRSGLDGSDIDDVIFAESAYGGGDLARYAAVELGMIQVPGQAVNRHCAGSLTAIGNAAASVMSGMTGAVVAGGVHSFSTAPTMTWKRLDGTQWQGMAPTFPYRADADDDVTLSTGFNVAERFGLSRMQMDAWALRSHQRAVKAIDSGTFDAEIIEVDLGKGTMFSVDEHPRRTTTAEKLAALPPLHPEIEGFSVTAGNSSGLNDGASALVVTSEDLAQSRGLRPLAHVRGWSAVGVDPKFTGVAAIDAIEAVLGRAKLRTSDIDLWEINEAFAAVPLAACQALGLNDELVNVSGSGCSLGHPVAASGGRMVVSLVHELHRRGGGRAVAAMCAGGGQGGAVLIEVPRAQTPLCPQLP
ncbi:thiolase family protein [Parafrankia sp. EUN1f]|uniref:thiolase family protein n=1 Tax=Parafrankia sp. EUN1f TaxID=102897 RepID=UPI0001C43AB3|nr:thiolase family protein [Parafrankia sp. EUN1f]EFC83479.1 acetyl-CoA acetyltransferase [Parafrankia sp. EUN1f]